MITEPLFAGGSAASINVKLFEYIQYCKRHDARMKLLSIILNNLDLILNMTMLAALSNSDTEKQIFMTKPKHFKRRKKKKNI